MSDENREDYIKKGRFTYSKKFLERYKLKALAEKLRNLERLGIEPAEKDVEGTEKEDNA